MLYIKALYDNQQNKTVYDLLKGEILVVFISLHCNEYFEPHFDPDVVNSFVKYVAIYPVGTGVVLNTKEIAIVVRANKNMPTRPVVRIIFDHAHRKLTK